MDQDRLARMYEATRLTSQGRFAEATACSSRARAAAAVPRHAIACCLGCHTGGRLPASVAKPRPEPVVPGPFLDLSYANAAGKRTCKLYVPTGYAGRGRAADRDAARRYAGRR